MRLEKITENNINDIVKKNIICIEKSMSYLNEMCERYDVAKNIRYIVDFNKKNIGKTTFRNRSIEIYGEEKLQEIEIDKDVVIILSDYYNEIYDKVKNVLDENNTNDFTIYYFQNKETEYEEYYRNKCIDKKLEDIIIFRSGPHQSAYIKGMDFADNARALFEYMLDNGYNEKYKLVWLVKEPDEFIKYSEKNNVEFLSFDWSVSDNKEERDRYYNALCLAKYIFFTDAYGFARNCRKDQIRIQLWHGCGFKTRVNFSRCEKRYDFTTVVSYMYAKIHADIYGLRDDQILVTGYAKHDWLFKPYKENLSTLLECQKCSKYIFWMPTFRMADDKLKNLNQYEMKTRTGLPIVEDINQFEQLNTMLKSLNMSLLVKLHPMQNNRSVIECQYSNIRIIRNEELVKKDLIINKILASADALISDYSSAAVDFLNRDKPIAFTLDDVEEYRNSRGFVFDNIRDWLPGKEIFNFEDLCDFIKEIAEDKDTTREKRNKIADKMIKYRDSNNCKRICEAFNITVEE